MSGTRGNQRNSALPSHIALLSNNLSDDKPIPLFPELGRLSPLNEAGIEKFTSYSDYSALYYSPPMEEIIHFFKLLKSDNTKYKSEFINLLDKCPSIICTPYYGLIDDDYLYGELPIIFAARHCDSELILSILIDELVKFDMNLKTVIIQPYKNEHGLNAAMIAALYGNWKALAKLLDKDPTLATHAATCEPNRGSTPFCCAISNNKISWENKEKIITTLLQKFNLTELKQAHDFIESINDSIDSKEKISNLIKEHLQIYNNIAPTFNQPMISQIGNPIMPVPTLSTSVNEQVVQQSLFPIEVMPTSLLSNSSGIIISSLFCQSYSNPNGVNPTPVQASSLNENSNSVSGSNSMNKTESEQKRKSPHISNRPNDSGLFTPPPKRKKIKTDYVEMMRQQRIAMGLDESVQSCTRPVSQNNY